MIMALDRLIHRYVLLKHPFFKTSADDVLKWMPFGFLLFCRHTGQENNIRMEKTSGNSGSR
jgi:hypothetical protein